MPGIGYKSCVESQASTWTSPAFCKNALIHAVTGENFSAGWSRHSGPPQGLYADTIVAAYRNATSNNPPEPRSNDIDTLLLLDAFSTALHAGTSVIMDGRGVNDADGKGCIVRHSNYGCCSKSGLSTFTLTRPPFRLLCHQLVGSRYDEILEWIHHLGGVPRKNEK